MNSPDQLKILIEQLINGITVGSFYALVALGYSMVYGVLSMVNFAHGDIFMVGAYFGYFTITRLSAAGVTQASPALAVALALLAGMTGAGFTGVLVERFAYRPLRRASRLASLIAAIGASLFLQEFVRLLPNMGTALASIRFGDTFLLPEGARNAIISVVKDFGGAMVKTYPGVLDVSGITLGNVTISYSRILIVGLSLITMAALYLLVRYTKLGKGMRAVSEDKDTAALMGVNVNRIISSTFFIGSALAGIAGVLVGMFYLQIRPSMGFVPGIKAFTSAVLGGIGSIPGAMIGGYMLGLAEVASIQVLPAVYKDIVAFVLLILTLIFRPTGILGSGKSQKKL